MPYINFYPSRRSTRRCVDSQSRGTFIKNLCKLQVLSQEYKDRIVALEAQLSGKDPPDGKTSFDNNKQNEGKTTTNVVIVTRNNL